MASIHIEALNRDMAPQACRMLALAFVTNPLNIAAFGPSQLARNEAFVLRTCKGQNQGRHPRPQTPAGLTYHTCSVSSVKSA